MPDSAASEMPEKLNDTDDTGLMLEPEHWIAGV
jgi:hypothetical protein